MQKKVPNRWSGLEQNWPGRHKGVQTRHGDKANRRFSAYIKWKMDKIRQGAENLVLFFLFRRVYHVWIFDCTVIGRTYECAGRI